MERIGVEFTGNSVGAVGAAKATAGAIGGVRREANTLSPSLRTAERDVGKLSRGALAGSGMFRGFGRSVAFASGAFLGGYGLISVLRSAVTVTLDSATSTAHLDQAIRNAHASVKALTPILERHAEASRKLGFADDETRKAEAELITAFGATKDALGELRVAQDLARTKNEDLSTATRDLIMLQQGNARAAKQFGLALPDLTAKQWAQKAAVDGLTISQEKGKTLYDELLPRIKDQAKAFAETPSGKIAEFHSEITKLEESIGTGLLPVVDKYLTRVDAWLADSGNQKRVTHDVEVVVHELEGALRDAYTATRDVLTVVGPVVHAMGGWKDVIEEIIALKFAWTMLGWADSIKKLTGSSAAAEGALGGIRLAAVRMAGPFAIAAAAVYALDKGLAKLTGYDALQKAWGSAGWFADNTAGDTFRGKNPYPKGSGQYYEWLAGTLHLKPGDKIPGGGTAEVHPSDPVYKQGAKAAGGGSFSGGALSNPVPGGAYGRIDQGVDYSAKLVHAIASGTIVSVGGGMAGPAGQPGRTTIIRQRFDKPVRVNGRTYHGAYYSEGVSLVQTGDYVAAGHAVMKGGGIEIGFLLGPPNDLTMPPLLGGLGAGTKPSQAGQDFAAVVQRLGGPGPGPYGPSLNTGQGGALAGAAAAAVAAATGATLIPLPTSKPTQAKPSPLKVPAPA